MSLTTKLSAVNTIIASVGEAPVNSLTDSTVEAAIAQNILDEASRAVQMDGWHFNTEKDVTLQPATSGEIKIPQNALKVSISRLQYPGITPVVRGLRLYDKQRHTYGFSSSIEAEITYLLDFEDLPEAARYYITVRAARMFQGRFNGSTPLTTFTDQDEAHARASLIDADADTSQQTLLDNWPVARVLRRL